MENKLLGIFYSYEKRISDIVNYIDNVQLTNQTATLLKNNKEYEEFVKKTNQVHNSPIHYNAVIISLYGCFEQYIYDLISTYYDELKGDISGLHQYSNNLTESYFNKIGDYLSNPQRFVDLNLSREIVVNNMKALIDESDFSLIKEILLKNSGNLRYKRLAFVFSENGFSGFENYLRSSEFYCKYLDQLKEDGQIPQRDLGDVKKKDERVFEILERLVTDRNKISHTWSDFIKTKLEDIRDHWIPFMGDFGKQLVEFMISEFEQFLFSNNIMVELLLIEHTTKSKIVCLNTGDNILNIDDVLFVTKFYENGKEYLYCKVVIKNIRYNGVDVLSVEANSDVALELNSCVHPSSKMYAKRIDTNLSN